MFGYSIVLALFILPVTVLAYLRIKAGRYPLPYFCNNIVVNRVKLRKSIGIFSPIAFWVLHATILLWSIQVEAWLSTLIVAGYMVASTLLWQEMKSKGVAVTPEIASASQSAPSLAPVQSVSGPTPRNFCSQCGKPATPNENFCGGCGTAVA
jgi:hypothetical protein